MALHVGGPAMKAKAIEGLTGTAEKLSEVIGSVGWIDFGPLGEAKKADTAAAGTYMNALTQHTRDLDEATKPYRSLWTSDVVEYHAPVFGADVNYFTALAQVQLASPLGWDGHSEAGAEAVDRARALAEENNGKDESHDYAAYWMLRDVNTKYSGGTTSNDIASYLRHGGFATEAPAKDSAGYRLEVEGLKQAWAGCDWQNPVDPRRVLNAPVMSAMVEWEQEYAGQSAQRATIVQAEADAASATRAATDDMIEAIRQAWLAKQILSWRKYWLNALASWPEHPGRPDQALYDRATADLAQARSIAAARADSAKTQAAEAAVAAQKAATAQQEAWSVADATHVPRGRGLMYAQQSVQVARASASAAQAAAKATETSLAATKATAEDADALLAKAQTESHTVNTEFRRVAAEEAAAQAKAAADSAEANAAAADQSANTAKSARTTAEQKRDKAEKAAATAASERAKAQTEKAVAAAERAKAAAERAKAVDAEERAGTQKTAAQSADTDAGTASADAQAKRKIADGKAKAAQIAREKVFSALRDKQAAAARAAALEAAAAAAAGTEAAAETRSAATAARTAATKAAEAATAAQSAADEATAAAVTARSAATKAEGAAERARASADAAWSAYYSSLGAASAAHAAAATALDASQEAAIRADNAGTAAENAAEAAEKAQEESSAAQSEADEAVKSAATVVGRAYAAGQAALAARDSAKEAVAASHEAISVGTPYQEKDSSAAFAVLVGQSSKTIAEQQAAAAAAKAAEANQAAVDAQAAAGQAQGDAKLAAEAAAHAAADSVRAAEAVARAQKSAAEAAQEQKNAKTAADAASAHAQQAGNNAASARLIASEVENEATAADREATDAERHAAEAQGKAGRSAEAAAEAARKAAEAEKAAKDAESKASDATGDSTAAEEAADKAEQEQREKNEAAHKDALAEGVTPIKGGADNWPVLGEREEKILLDACGQTCVDDYRDGLKAVSVGIVKWATDNGGQILFDQLDAAKVEQCLAVSDVETCLWDLVDVASNAVIVGRMPALAQAIEKVSSGVRRIFVDADKALVRLNELTAVIRDARATPRRDRCLAGVALHAGGAQMKAKAIDGLTGTNAELNAVIGDVGWIGFGPLGQAQDKDSAAGTTYMDAIAARQALLEDANRPYAMSSFDDGITLHAPEFSKDILGFTLAVQYELSHRLGRDDHTNPSAEALAKAREITEQNRGKDTWFDFEADIMLRDVSNTRYSGVTTASDIATYLRHGGFLAGKVSEDSPGFRSEVEYLKQAWAGCDHTDPIDPRNSLSEAASQASAEWEAEYAAQAAPRALIMRAEADAAAATRAAADNMVDAIGQAWLADQILRWQKYWHDRLEHDPSPLDKPKKALFDRANTDLAKARGRVQALKAAAAGQATAANAASARAVTAQQQAWTIADAAEVPRGRGLMYAQQSVQVARASGAAATAAAKATETALNAANATVSTSQALLALAKTESHAVSTEFHRIAAQEAAAQAKAAANSADAYATSAANNAAVAKKAKEDAAAAEGRARQAAADAQRTRGIADLERANAAAYRATAERERDLAAGHEADAVAQGRIASDARTSAEASGTVAANQRKAAEQAERDAVAARNDALEAEQRRDSLKAKAEALEANAAADEGTDAAEASRTAATDARSAANTATTAATSARAAANAATTAAVNAREAATKAEGAASRARAAADATWASYLVAAGSAATAHAKAAEAIDASEAAAADAKGAKDESAKVNAAAKTAKTEATAARSEAQQTANWAAVTAGKAQAAVASSLAARDSAAAVTRPAQDAIALGTPYQQQDSSAAFAVLTGQASLTVAQQQAASAAATADLAEKFSAEAKALAAQASADMKLALEASAAAADDSLRAAKAYQRAQASANQAAADAKAAQGSATRADGYAQAAGAEAMAANSAANDAERDAVAADSAATEAEHDAAHARQVATQAEADAVAARSSADKAEIDATAAEKAAEGARQAAEEAQDAADRTEKRGSSEQISQGATTSISDVWAVLDHIEYIGDPKNVVKDNCNPIWHVGDCKITADITYRSHVDVYMCMMPWESYIAAGICPAAETVFLGPEVTDQQKKTITVTLTMTEFNSGIDPIDVLLGDFIGCAKKLMPGLPGGTWGDCAWAIGWFVGGLLFRTGKTAVMAMDAAVKTGIGFMDAFMALRTVGLTEAAVQGIISRIFRKLGTACEAAGTASLKLAKFSVAAATANDDVIKKCGEILKDIVKDGDHIVLGVNRGKDLPGSDNLAAKIGGKTFNNKNYGIVMPESIGYGQRALWTVGVERAVENPKVTISVCLDGVDGAKTADEALSMLLARGETIENSSWEAVQAGGYGTAWEMVKLRTSMRMEYRSWKSVNWYMYNPVEKKYELVHPTRFTYSNGTPVE
ncbi:polymorphic toxin type 27 domain-containing protein [Streptomyces sp. NPDC046203]|uniref:polymorphic toxin type 27 domain-containing protein n=1 Tax=Streptomyces sp. NPDC046203 TaxID=3154602 RepID=UPI0033C12B88